MALSKQQEKLIKSLHTKKGREKTGLCLVEGKKVITAASNYLIYKFTVAESDNFLDLVSTDTPPDLAGVAKIPCWTKDDLFKKNILVVLDGVQDPGNVGTILRLCLGFNAGLLLINSADVTNSKVIRSSVGTMFQVPWLKVNESGIEKCLTGYQIYRLEKGGQEEISGEKIALIAGSEGQGISLKIKGESLGIKHDEKLESLNVASALAISLYQIYGK